jgi:hypothetical protein
VFVKQRLRRAVTAGAAPKLQGSRLLRTTVMPSDPLAILLAAAFTSGCASIHALRHHADGLTFVLAVMAYALATAVGSLLAARFGLLMAPDHAGGWMAVAIGGG